jgi:hypothetical protein
VADASGKAVGAEHAAFLKAAKVLSDTRLKPDETRKETFTFDAAPGTHTEIRATLSYYYSPSSRVESQRQMAFLSLRGSAR